jgi:hypothetical protein
MTTEPTSLITEELIEVGAIATVAFDAADVAEAVRARRPLDGGVGLFEKHKEMARACLEAVLPMVGERIAQEAEQVPTQRSAAAWRSSFAHRVLALSKRQE